MNRQERKNRDREVANPNGEVCPLILRGPSYFGTRGRARLRFSSVTLLLVEDHHGSRIALSILLRRCGHEVVAAENLADALLLIGNIRFDALVSDIGLPDGTGLELVAEAKRRQPWKKTVALTGRAMPEDRELGLRAGFDEYLTKPLDFQRLRSLLAECA
jgi:CheY-like chemotaxis protein